MSVDTRATGRRLDAYHQTQVGDIVVYGKYCGTEIDIDGDEHMICRESELLGVVEK